MGKTIKKYRILLCIEFLLFLLLLFRCFKEEKLVYTDTDFVLNTDTSLYEGYHFQVTPGVYQVRVNLAKLQGETIFVNVFCGQSSFRALRCNGASIYQGQNNVDFEVYVTDKIDSVYVSCSLTGTQAVISSLEVYQTNLGAKMLVFLFLVCCLVLNFLLFFREAVLLGNIKREQQAVVWGLLASIFIAYFPYMTDYFSNVGEVVSNCQRIESIKESWIQGDLFLLIPVLFRWIGFSLMDSYKMFVFLVMTVTAGIAYYSFKQCTKHTYAALWGSILYMLAPHRIAAFYQKGAVGEYMAMVFLPLVICGMYRLYTEDVNSEDYNRVKLLLIIGLSGILQSHILLCVITIIGVLAMLVIFCKKTVRRQTLFQLLQTVGGFLLINAWFWIPRLHMLLSDNSILSEMISENIPDTTTRLAQLFQFYANQEATQNGLYMTGAFQIGITPFLMLVIILIAGIRKVLFKKERAYQNPYDKIVFFWCGMLFFYWFLGIAFISCVFTAVLASFFFLWFDRECQRRIQEKAICELWKKGGIMVLLILTIGSAVYHVNEIIYFAKPLWLYHAENLETDSYDNKYKLITDNDLEWLVYKKKETETPLYVSNTEIDWETAGRIS